MIEKIKSKIYKLLRWSEKYTKTDMVYLTKGMSWLTLGKFVSSLSSFLLAIAFANLLPKETYGTYKFILSTASLLAIPTLGGMGTAVIQAVARGYEGSLLPALKIKLQWGALGALASLGLAGYYYLQNNITLAISFLIIASFVPLMNSFNIYDAFLNGKKLFKNATQYGAISQIIAVSILITTLFFTKNLFLILLAYFIPWTIVRFISLKITLKKFPPNKKEEPKTIYYGKHLSLVGVVGAIASQLDKILLFYYLGAVQVAIYYMAIAPVEQFKGILKNIGILALPKFSERPLKKIDTLLYKRLAQLFLIGLAVSGIYFFIAPYFFKIFFPQYIESIFYSQIFAITIALMLPSGIFGSAIMSKLSVMPKKLVYLPNLVADITLITSLLILTPRFGIIGVILSRMIFLTSVLIIYSVVWIKLKIITAEYE